LNDGRAAAFPATIHGAVLAAPALSAAIAGRPGERTLQGTMRFNVCAPIPFRAIRRPPMNRGE